MVATKLADRWSLACMNKCISFVFILWFLIRNVDCNYLLPMFYYFVFSYCLANCMSLLFFINDLCFNLLNIGWILSKYIVDHSFLNASPLWTEIGFILISGSSLLHSEMGCFISGFLLAIPLNICTPKWHNIQIATGKSFWNILF